MPLKKSVIEAFETLDLTPDAKYADAAKSYKRMALEHHPDRNHGDSTATERFQKVCATI
jgi:DnaJ-class molecular chaperone